jgi:hypothetical protein
MQIAPKQLLLTLIAGLLLIYVLGWSVIVSHLAGSPFSLPNIEPSTEFVHLSILFLSSFPYLSLVLVSLGILIGIAGQMTTTPISFGQTSPTHQISTNIDRLLLVIAVFLGAILVWIPRMIQTLPIGSDTLYYMSVVETTTREGIIWPILYTDKPLLYVMLTGAQNLSGLSLIEFFRILPVALSVGAVLSVWFFVKGFYSEAAGFSAIFTALSTALMRTSIDLYASFIAMIFLFLFLGIYFRYRERKTQRLQILSQLLLVILILCYWFVWLLAITIIIFAELLSPRRIEKMRSLIQILIPSTLLMVTLFVVAITIPPPTYWGLGSSFALYLGKAVTPIGVITYDTAALDQSNLSLLGQDNFIIPFLAAIGLLLLTPRSFPMKSIYLWSIFLLILSLVSTTGTHAALLVPLPALAGIGLRRLLELR